MKLLKIGLIFSVFFCFGASKHPNYSSSYVLMESSSSRIIESSNEETPLLIASITKIMTAIVAIENYDINDSIVFTKADVHAEGSKIYLDEGDSLTRRDLLYGLLLRSGNDAASALSKQDDFSFIYLMNEYVKKIGMEHTVFVNASGLDETTYNTSSAIDMAKLMIYAMKNEIFREICGAKTYQTVSSKEKNYHFSNKHRLVQSGKAIAGKTGYTTLSKRTLVTAFERNGTEFICVTLNDSNDWNHHMQLLRQADGFNYKTIAKAGIYETKFDVDFYIYLPKDIVLPVRKNERKIELKYYVNDIDVYLKIYSNDRLISKIKLATSPIA